MPLEETALTPERFDPLRLLSERGRIQTMQALGLLDYGGSTTEVARFLTQRVEVNFFPPIDLGLRVPQELKGDLIGLLDKMPDEVPDAFELLQRKDHILDAIGLDPKNWYSYLQGVRWGLSHLVALRFVTLGIPSNPVEIHMEGLRWGCITTERAFSPKGWPQRGYVSELSEEDKPKAINALRIAGVLHDNQPPFTVLFGAKAWLPPRGYEISSWPAVRKECPEERKVWKFQIL